MCGLRTFLTHSLIPTNIVGFTCLSYLAVSAGTAKVLNWWISLVTASQLLNWIIMSSSWIRFNNAIKVQGLDRETFLPYRSRFQPFCAWYALIMSTIVLIISGYTLFYPGAFAADEFIFQCMQRSNRARQLADCSHRWHGVYRHRLLCHLEAGQAHEIPEG